MADADSIERVGPGVNGRGNKIGGYPLGPLRQLKAAVHLNAIFPPLRCPYWKCLVHVLSNPKTLCLKHESTLCVFCKFLDDFEYAWEEIVLLKGFVKFQEIRNVEG